MVVNDDAGHLVSHGVWAGIASKLAPTNGIEAGPLATASLLL